MADAADHPAPETARALLRAGRFEAAIAAAERDLRAAPADPAAWRELAEILLAARRPDAALAVCDRGFSLGVDEPDLICAKAQVLQSLSRIDEARALYAEALARAPDRLDAAFGLARLALEAGDWTEARALHAQLSAAAPERPEFAWLAARIALGAGDFEQARARFAALAGDPRLPPEQIADALLALGEALDALGRPREAFEAALRGKQIQRRLFAERAAGREGVVARFERLANWFGATDPAPWRTAPPQTGEESEGHVFLVGFPRSGTTLLEQALAGHPRLVALEEAPTLAEPHAAFMSSPAGLTRLAHLSADEAAHWRARYWAAVRAHGVEPRGRVFLDKAPAGTEDLPLVAKLFPRARVLFALRDPRDVVLSCLRNAFQLNAMTYAFTDLQETAACYAAGMRLAQVYRRVLPLDLLEVRHESLVADFEDGLAKICAFLGLEPDPAMRDVAATARRRNVRTPSAGQVRAGLNTRGLGRWRAYADQLAPASPILAPWIERFGYPP